jgi:hypothetical protein
MHRTGKLGLAVALALALSACVPAQAASPFTGKRALRVLDNIQEIHLCNFTVTEKDDKVDVQLGATLPNFKGIKLEDVKSDGKVLHFNLKGGPVAFRIALHPAKGGQLRGGLSIGDNVLLAFTETVDDADADIKTPARPTPGAEEMAPLMRETDKEKRIKGLEELVEKNAGKPIELLALTALATTRVEAEASDDNIKKAVDGATKVAATYGPDVEGNTLLGLTRTILKGKNANLALEYARKVAATVKPETPLGQQVARLKLLSTALHKAGKASEAGELDTELVKLETRLDEEFEKTAIPFDPEVFAGRKSKSDRIAVVELFTGAQCPPCVAADVAFDAALKAYKPKDVILLQYHLHIPGPDPLTNDDSEGRQKYYGEAIRGTPTAFVNGQATDGLGGPKQLAKGSFEKLSSSLGKALEQTPKAQLKLTVDRKGDALDLAAAVEDVQSPGEKTRLRFVLVEEKVRYPGRNGQRMHHHVVRAFPGGVEGFALKDKSSKQTAKVSLTEVRDALAKYLEKAGARRPFLDEERPLDLKHLKVVALVQDDESKEIIQAAQADVPE